MKEELLTKKLNKLERRTSLHTDFKRIASAVNDDIANGYELDGDLTRSGENLAQLLKPTTHKPAPVIYKIIQARAAAEAEARGELNRRVEFEAKDGFSKRGEPVLIPANKDIDYPVAGSVWIYQVVVKDGVYVADSEAED